MHWEQLKNSKKIKIEVQKEASKSTVRNHSRVKWRGRCDGGAPFPKMLGGVDGTPRLALIHALGATKFEQINI